MSPLLLPFSYAWDHWESTTFWFRHNYPRGCSDWIWLSSVPLHVASLMPSACITLDNPKTAKSCLWIDAASRKPTLLSSWCIILNLMFLEPSLKHLLPSFMCLLCASPCVVRRRFHLKTTLTTDAGRNLSAWHNGQMASPDSAKSLTSAVQPVPLWVRNCTAVRLILCTWYKMGACEADGPRD